MSMMKQLAVDNSFYILKSFRSSKTLCFIFTVTVILYCSTTCFSEVKPDDGTVEGSPTKFCFNAKKEGHHFKCTVRRRLHALSGPHCVLQCLHDQCCRSVNFRKKRYENGSDDEDNCELLHAVASEQTVYLKQNEHYNYYVLLLPERKFKESCLYRNSSGKQSEEEQFGDSFLIHHFAKSQNRCITYEPSSWRITVRPCNLTSSKQKWRWTQHGQLKPIHTLKCLSVSGTPKNFLNVTLAHCEMGNTNQVWTCVGNLVSLVNSSYNLRYAKAHTDQVVLYNGTGKRSMWKVYGENKTLCEKRPIC